MGRLIPVSNNSSNLGCMGYNHIRPIVIWHTNIDSARWTGPCVLWYSIFCSCSISIQRNHLKLLKNITCNVRMINAGDISDHDLTWDTLCPDDDWAIECLLLAFWRNNYCLVLNVLCCICCSAFSQDFPELWCWRLMLPASGRVKLFLWGEVFMIIPGWSPKTPHTARQGQGQWTAKTVLTHWPWEIWMKF